MLLVDALGYDMVTPEVMPYLSGLENEGRFSPLTPVLGYSDAQRAALFTGGYPADIGYWTDSRMSYNSSVLRPFSYLAPLDHLPSDLIRRGIKFMLANSATPIQARRTGFRSLPLYNIPFRVMGHFQPALRGTMFDPCPFPDAPTIFDLMRAQRLKFSVVQSDRFGLRNMFRMPDALSPRLCRAIEQVDTDTQLLYVYLHSVDTLGHRHGIRSHQFPKVLASADRTIESIIEAARQRLGPDLETVIVSDHGFNHTERFVDLGYLLKQLGFGREYLAALDSTMVRVWYFNDAARSRIRPLIEELGLGEFLSPEELRELGVNFTSRDYFDEVYLLRPGISIYPNYHSYLKPMAMHAYHPDGADQQGVAFFLGRRLAEVRPVTAKLHMTDIMPIVAGLLGLESPQVAGRSRQLQRR